MKVIGKVLLLFLIPASLAQAADSNFTPALSRLENRPLKSHSNLKTIGEFVHPNETEPKGLIPHLKNLPSSSGAYLGVGTERISMALALADGVIYGVFADIDPDVVIYNRMNVILWAVAKNLTEYNHLRFRASKERLQSWVKTYMREDPLFQMRQFFSPQIILETISDSNLETWRKYARSAPLPQRYDRPSRPTLQDFEPGSGPNGNFSGAKYTTNEAQFKKLHNLVLYGGGVAVLQIDFTSEEDVNNLVSALQADKVHLKGVDISNLMDGYGFYFNTQANLFRSLQPVMREDGLVIATRKANAKRQSRWYYASVPYHDIKALDGADDEFDVSDLFTKKFTEAVQLEECAEILGEKK